MEDIPEDRSGERSERSDSSEEKRGERSERSDSSEERRGERSERSDSSEEKRGERSERRQKTGVQQRTKPEDNSEKAGPSVALSKVELRKRKMSDLAAGVDKCIADYSLLLSNTALSNVKQKLESHEVEGQEERPFLNQVAEGLKKEMQDLQQVVYDTVERSKASHQLQIREHKAGTKKITSAIKKVEDQLETERLYRQQRRTFLLKEIEKSRAQLDKQEHRNETLVAELSNAKQKRESHQVEWQEDKTCLNQRIEGLKKTAQDLQQQVNYTKASHQLQIREHKAETREIASALKEAEDQLKTEHLCCMLLEENNALMAALNEGSQQVDKHLMQRQEFEIQKDEISTLTAALTKAEQELGACQEEITYLSQAKRDLERTLQEKELEWEEEEIAMRHKREELMSKKKKKKKWFRKLF